MVVNLVSNHLQVNYAMKMRSYSAQLIGVNRVHMIFCLRFLYETCLWGELLQALTVTDRLTETLSLYESHYRHV